MRKGFSLLEFVILCALVLVASTVLMPRALAPRRSVNEDQALAYLAMIGAGQRAWRAETGAYVALARLSETPPQRRATAGSTRTPLMSPDLMVDDWDIAHRAGFRFRLARGADGAVQGCWAWPNLRGFSGEQVYFADFARAEIRRQTTDAEWERAPELAPAADALADPPIARF
jgi:type II secretory pathway pseudopilin PulG